jgi:hypothetical protein
LAAEARARGRWCQLRAREVAVDRCTTLGGGDWTGRSSEWADDGEAPTTEEADDGLVVLRWFRGGALGAVDSAPSRRNPGRHRGKRHGMALLIGCGSSKRSGGAGESERAGKEEESDFTSSMGHSGEGIRVTWRLEAMGIVHERDGVNRGCGQTVGGGGRRGRQ